ncbi:NAD(P)-binding protein [Ganoderma leucocontextum]|nr:NAD(P)-binding protein [Ganoderma leucocontextum]
MGEVEAHKEGPVRELFESKFWGAAKVTSEAVRFFREGHTESLASELGPSWNIKVAPINPAGFHTEGQAKTTWALAPRVQQPRPSCHSGDVNKAVEVIYRLASEPDPPLRLLLGESAHTYLKQKITRLAADMEKYASWSENLKKDGL